MVQTTLWPEDETNNQDDYESSLEENDCPHTGCESGSCACEMHTDEEWDWKDCDCEECSCQEEEEDEVDAS